MATSDIIVAIAEEVTTNGLTVTLPTDYLGSGLSGFRGNYGTYDGTHYFCGVVEASEQATIDDYLAKKWVQQADADLVSVLNEHTGYDYTLAQWLDYLAN